MKYKVSMLIACICIVLGAMLIGAGFGLGGELHDVLGVNFGNVRLGIWGNGGSTGKTETIELSEFDTLTMDISIGDIIVKRGNSLALTIVNVPSDEYSVKQDGTALTIKSHQDVNLFNFSLDRFDYEFVLTVPKDMEIKQADITSNMGDIEVSNLLFRELSITQHMGDMELSDVDSEEIKLDQNMGDITYKGSHPGNMNVDNAMGDIEIMIQDAMSNYRYHCSTSMGSIKVNNQHQDGFSEELSGGSSNAPYEVIVDNAMGDIEVEFDHD